MANEVTVTATLVYSDGSVASFTRTLSALGVTVTTKKFIHHVQSIGTSEEALDLGELVAPLGWAWFKNLDSTNYVEVRMATGASNDHVRMNAGEPALFRFGSDVTAPFAIANASAVLLEYIIVLP